MNRYMTANTKIITDEKDTAVQLALRSLHRDMEKTFTPSEEEGLKIRLVRRPAEEECFVLEQTENVLELGADSELVLYMGFMKLAADFWECRISGSGTTSSLRGEKELKLHRDFFIGQNRTVFGCEDGLSMTKC